MKSLKLFYLLFSCFFSYGVFAQNIPSEKIIGVNDLQYYLKQEVIQELGGTKAITQAKLAQYFRDKFSERFFYDWKNNDARFKQYALLYPNAQSTHTKNALDHLAKFDAVTPWKLPFNYKNGEPVNAYAMRHLARQHKMADIAFYYRFQNKNSVYLNYFKDQLKSLNTALALNRYETIGDGNGVYEAFRSGYRVLNWLQIHNLFLGEKNYSDEDQLLTVATLIQHASNLYETNAEFVPGNHQTRGMSALAMLSILFSDFKDSDLWKDRAMSLLQEHLSKEINKDGFQFERTVHYHISDIDNYFYVYQLAKNSRVKIDSILELKLRSLFETLPKIAYPDKSAPVFSDDTNAPWAEKNDISGALALGFLLFKDPEMGYFASEQVPANVYWYLSDAQLKSLSNLKAQAPVVQSVDFPETGYFIMREGWKKDDKVMAISNGLDRYKPDHQHGDMLGIQAMANGNVILPNYQVRYSLKDYEFFKNSMVKNVALVDDELQGKEYAGNQGGSGFGKFRSLPQPQNIAWNTNEDLDLYIGSHNGFENIGVKYSRQVIYVKNDFWLVKDNFRSNAPHTYKQIWQGHYTSQKGPDLLRSSFDHGSGNDIYQLKPADAVSSSGTQGKQWNVVSKNNMSNYSFITAVVPFKTFDQSIDQYREKPSVKGWKINDLQWKTEGAQAISLTKENSAVFFSVKSITAGNIQFRFSEEADAFVKIEGNKVLIQSLNEKDVILDYQYLKNKKITVLKPGEQVEVNTK